MVAGMKTFRLSPTTSREAGTLSRRVTNISTGLVRCREIRRNGKLQSRRIPGWHNSRRSMINQLTFVERPVAILGRAGGSGTAVGADIRQGLATPWITFSLVAVGTFMIMLDASIVNISLPAI